MSEEYKKDFSAMQIDNVTHDFNGVLSIIDILLYGFENDKTYKAHLPEADYQRFTENATIIRSQVWKLKALYQEAAKRAKALEQ